MCYTLIMATEMDKLTVTFQGKKECQTSEQFRHLLKGKGMSINAMLKKMIESFNTNHDD